MIIEVEYKDNNGNIENKRYELTKLAFIKHLVCSGNYYEPFYYKIARAIGACFYFIHYFPKGNENCFSIPDELYSEPTAKGQFSNIAGKTIADFLAKKIDGSSFTIHYEAAMRKNKSGSTGHRPDLIAYRKKDGKKEQFAIEAKGYSKQNISDNEMKKHKLQASSGNISVNFSVASVSYNLYKKVKCKYYDPKEQDNAFDKEQFIKLTKEYYLFWYNLVKDIPEVYRKKRTFYQEEFISVRVIDLIFHYYFNDAPSSVYSMFQVLDVASVNNYVDKRDFRNLSLLLPKKIEEYAKNGLEDILLPLPSDNELENSESIYIDNDRIGLGYL